MNPISLFPAYNQSENRLTNYVGLTLKLIYEESPTQFQNWLASILPESEGLVVGPVFRQQSKGEKGVADLVIRQTGFSIAVETKLQDWHYSEQLKRHIADLGAQGSRTLLALANFEHDHPELRHEEAMKLAQEAKVGVVFMSYEELIQSLSQLNLSARLDQIIEELQMFLDQSGLLPVWKYLLDVVNCGVTQNEIHLGAYLCPNTGGPYSHRRAKYLGTYYGKRVNTIHEIRALVTVGIDQKPGQVLWNNTEEPEESLISEALGILKQCESWRINENMSKELQVFLLKSGHKTNFIKKDAGGMMQSKKYFWNIAQVLQADSAEALAGRLDGRNWDEFSF
jgi:hypothetical protein